MFIQSVEFFIKNYQLELITETNENTKTITIGYKVDDISFYI